MSLLHIALHQSSGTPGSVKDNLKDLDEAAQRAASKGARLLIAPELFLTGFVDDVTDLAEAASGPSATAITKIAERYEMAVAYGYAERDGDDVYNSLQLIAPGRPEPTNYRKTHLYGMWEKERFTPGTDLVVQTEVDGVKTGLLVCYDVEFPENVRAHAIEGTDLLVVPTALMSPYQFVADSLVPTRAFENQMYIAYADRVGTEGEFTFVGRSTLAGPDGTARARAGSDKELIFGDLDPAFLADSREHNTYLRDRRPELYVPLAEQGNS
ncbi:carbon-nitrogen hydrolase family protein [Streptomyces caniferus]|uniref:carbon-nitrogen hydrolase family protein n=1 Tax=Streptomyces caniferus TaxID=285557 RepID=UPI003454843F